MKLDVIWVEPIARQVMTRSMTVVMFRERASDLYAVAQVFRRHGVVRAPNYSLPGWSMADLEDTATVLDFVPLNAAQTRYEALCVHPFLSL